MSAIPGELPAATRDFYVRSMRVLNDAGVPYLVGGAYALTPVTGIERHTKDLDLFLRPDDRDRALEALGASGCHTEVTFPHWLAKAYAHDPTRNGSTPPAFIDLIYRSGNGVAEVDDAWFARAGEAEVLGERVRLVPSEESLWSKAFVMERERFDGADVAHLILACGPDLDWRHLVDRFGPHYRVLLAHLILFGFIYPSRRDRIPAAVIEELTGRLRRETATPPTVEEVCQGTLLSRAQYLVDLEREGLIDARVEPRGAMTPDDVATWTEGIARDGPG